MPGSPRSKFFSNLVRASNPAGLPLSEARLRRLRPDLYEIPSWQRPFVVLMCGGQRAADRRRYTEHLQLGDARAAVVLSVAPLLIAAYSDELDCVAILRFDDALAVEHAPAVGQRLLTVNAYQIHVPGQADLLPGPYNTRRYNALYPLIADFLTDDREALEARKATIEESEWQRAEALGEEYLQTNPGVHRDGRPGYSQKAGPRAKAGTVPVPR